MRAPYAISAAMRAALITARNDGGTLEIGGVDGRRVRVDVLHRLVSEGFLREGPHEFFRTTYVLTDEGRKIINPSKEHRT